MKNLIVFLLFSINLSCFSAEAKLPKKKPIAVQREKKDKQRPSVPALAREVCRRNPTFPASKIDIQERICSGRELLKNERAEIKVCEKKKTICRGKGKKRQCRTVVTAQPICYRTIILVSMDAKTGQMSVVEMKNGKPSKPGYAILRGTADGVDTEYEVKSPPGQVVLAIQYPLTVRTGRGMERVRAVYTPYSDELVSAFPELIEFGYLYLYHKLEEARDKITESGVDVSRVGWEALFALVLVEHFTNEVVASQDVEKEARRVLATIGANQELAYRYSVSSARARGMAQIIPRTWMALHRRYPKLVSADFYRGAATHSVALIAQTLLAKEDLQFLFSQRSWRKNADKQKEFLSDSRAVGEYLALAYNGGAPRAYRWLESERTAALPREGSLYIKKFNQIWQWHKGIKCRTTNVRCRLTL
jgi:hypothetical protein